MKLKMKNQSADKQSSNLFSLVLIISLVTIAACFVFPKGPWWANLAIWLAFTLFGFALGVWAEYEAEKSVFKNWPKRPKTPGIPPRSLNT